MSTPAQIAYPAAIVILLVLVLVRERAARRRAAQHRQDVADHREAMTYRSRVHMHQISDYSRRIAQTEKHHADETAGLRGQIEVANRERELYRELRFGILRAFGIPLEETAKSSLIVERRDDRLIITWSEFLRNERGTRYVVPTTDGGHETARRKMQRVYRAEDAATEMQPAEGKGVLVA